MKFLILFFIGFYIQPVFAQVKADHLPLNNQYRLVAENGKRARKYVNRQPLKIEYRENGEIRKEKEGSFFSMRMKYACFLMEKKISLI